MSFYDDASWLLIPSGIEEDIVFAQKPISGLGDLSFTRASDATYTDASGVVRRSPYNLVTFSEDFSNAIWGKGATSITTNTTTAPNGTLTADTLTADGTLNFHNLAHVGNSVNGVTYTQSIYVKRGTNNFIQIIGTGGIYTSTTVFANFDLLNGTLGSSGGGAISTITNVGNGWYRCTMTATATATATGSAFLINIIPSATSTRAESSTLTTSVFVWGAQVNEGTEALDYFPTTNRQDVPRIDFRNADGTLSSCGRLLLEPQRTNSIRNSSMVGAVAGSPGTVPTNWVYDGGTLAYSVTGVGVENGLPYTDIRVNGTANLNRLRILFEGAATIAASNGQSWSLSPYVRVTNATSPPLNYNLQMFENTSAGALVTVGSVAFTPTANLTRYNFVRTLSGGATVAAVQPMIQIGLTVGATYDFTIRIAAPQMELGAYATTWVPTTTAAVTRIKDSFTRTNIFTNGFITSAGGTWFVDLSNNVILTRDNAGVGLGINTGTVQTTGNGFNLRRGGPTSRFSLFKIINGTGTNIHITSSNDIKLAVKWNGTTADVFENGVKVVTATDFTPTAMQNILGELLDPIYINQMLLAPTPLSDAECIQLTTL